MWVNSHMSVSAATTVVISRMTNPVLGLSAGLTVHYFQDVLTPIPKKTRINLQDPKQLLIFGIVDFLLGSAIVLSAYFFLQQNPLILFGAFITLLPDLDKFRNKVSFVNSICSIQPFKFFVWLHAKIHWWKTDYISFVIFCWLANIGGGIIYLYLVCK